MVFCLCNNRWSSVVYFNLIINFKIISVLMELDFKGKLFLLITQAHDYRNVDIRSQIHLHINQSLSLPFHFSLIVPIFTPVIKSSTISFCKGKYFNGETSFIKIENYLWIILKSCRIWAFQDTWLLDFNFFQSKQG